MASLILQNGDMLSINGLRYTCGGKGPAGRYLLIPHKGRGNRYLSPEQLFDLSQEGNIEFIKDEEYYGDSPPAYQADLSYLPTSEQEAVVMRHFYMKELEKYRSSGGKLSVQPLKNFLLETHQLYKQDCKGSGIHVPDKAMSVSAIKRWYKKWVESGHEFTSLLHKRRGNSHSKLTLRQRELLDEFINRIFLTPQRETRKEVHTLLSANINLINRGLKSNNAPEINSISYVTVCKHIQDLDEYEVLSRRFSHLYAQNNTRLQGSTKPFTRHLQLVQADHTQIDIYVDIGIKNLIRPYLTLILDSYSKAILGYWLSLEPPSSDSVMNALRMAVMPKEPVWDEKTEKHYLWPMMGIPSELLLDNGADFKGLDVRLACGGLTITPTFTPPRKPYYKSQIERKFGQINKQVWNKMPGQVFKYEPKKHGLEYPHLTFDDLNRVLSLWIVSILHQTPVQGGRTPNELWADSVSKHGMPGTGFSDEYIRITLAKSSHKEFNLEPEGIHFNSLTYSNELLSRYRNQIKSNFPHSDPKVTFKWSATNVGVIWVYDTLAKAYFPVEAKDENAHGRSLFNHKVNLREVRNRVQARLNDDSYHDAVIAIRSRIDEAVLKNGSSKIPARGVRYISGEPNTINKVIDPALPTDGRINQEDESRLLNKPDEHIAPTLPSSSTDNEDDIDDIADEMDYS